MQKWIRLKFLATLLFSSISFFSIAGSGCAQNPVAELDRKVREGKVDLKFDGAQGYLRALLAALDIPIESQMVVYSKTSVQALRIDPHNPRTLFFNDSVIVGWVRGGFIEIAVQDPQKGILFYTVDQRPWVHQDRMKNAEARAHSLFEPRQDCLNCHVSRATFGIPGTLLRSVSTGPDGIPGAGTPQLNTDLRTPFDQLWGGWYVSGSSGSQHHRGNGVLAFNTDAYLSPYSDIVALMVFEHQTRTMNLIARAAGDPRVVNELADSLLFSGEPPLTDKITGSSGFAEKFAARGPLRQFDLERRLMRYPCSYMIYTEAFDALPAPVKDAIYRRIWQTLPTKTHGREAMEILRTSRKDLPDSLRPTIK
jgi:hypothetical protein